MKKMVFLLSLIVFLPAMQLVCGTEFKEIEVSEAEAVQINPEIYGNLIVWEDYRNDPFGGYKGPGIGNPDIYAYNLNTHEEFSICTQKSDDGESSSAQQNPDIWGDLVVWEDWRNGNADIYIYDLSDPFQLENGTRLTFNQKNQLSPRIWQNYVVWIDYRNGLDGDIYGFNLSMDSDGDGIVDWKEPDFDENIGRFSLFPVSTNIFEQRDVDIYGHIVVWKDYRNDTGNGNRDIYAYDIYEKREFEICTERHNQFQPAIYEDIVIWVDMRTGTPSIMGKNLSSGKELDFSTGNPGRYPAIWEKTIVWVETENWTEYLRISEIGGETRIPVGYGWNQRFPSVSSRGVVWSDGRNVKYDLYGRTKIIWKIRFLRTSNLPPVIRNPMIFPDYTGSKEKNITINAEIFDPEGDNFTAYLTSSLFGNITMFDDGRHGDGVAGDGIYGTRILVNTDREIRLKIVVRDEYGANTSVSITIPVEKNINALNVLLGLFSLIAVGVILIILIYLIRKKTRKELEES